MTNADAISLLRGLEKSLDVYFGLNDAGKKAFNKAIKALEAQEWIPCKVGHWVEVHGYATPGGDPVWACSECGKGIHVYGVEHGTYGSDVSDGQWVSCPNCGAVMINEKGN